MFASPPLDFSSVMESRFTFTSLRTVRAEWTTGGGACGWAHKRAHME